MSTSVRKARIKKTRQRQEAHKEWKKENADKQKILPGFMDPEDRKNMKAPTEPPR